MLPVSMNHRLMLIIATPVCLIGSILAYLLWPQTPITFIRLSDDRVGDVCVVGTSECRWDGWWVGLFWRKFPNSPWMVYPLDHESMLWKNVKITVKDKSVEIKREGKVIGQLNTIDGSFKDDYRASTISCPTRILSADDVLSTTGQVVYRDCPGWTSVWPRILGTR